MKKFNRFSFVLLIMISLFDFVGLSVAATLFPYIILNNYGNILGATDTMSLKITIVGLLMGIYPLGQIFGASLFGQLSDTFGRKNILLATVFGTIVGTIVCACSIELGSLLMLFVGRFFSGLCAGNVAVAQASVIDMSDESTASGRISIFQTGMGMGWVIGPVLGGLMSSSSGFFKNIPASTPVWCVVGFLSIIFVLIALFFKETIQNKNMSKIKILSSLTSFSKAFTFKGLRTLLFIWALFVGGWMIAEQFFPTFLYRSWHLSQLQVGFLIGSTGLLFSISQFLISKPLSKKFSSKFLSKISIFLTGIALVGMGLSPSILILCVFTFLFVVSIATALPNIIVEISSRVPMSKQGEIMGMISSIQALTTIISAMCAGPIVGALSNFGLLCGGAMMIGAVFVFGVYEKIMTASGDALEINKAVIAK